MQLSLTTRSLTLLAAAVVLLAATGLGAAEGAVTVKVQGVLATGSSANVAGTVPPSLQAYAEVLRRFPFDKFEDIGGGASAVKVGQTGSIKVGSHTIEITLAEVAKGTAKIKYTIKDSSGAALGSNAMALAAGQIVPIQVGDPKFPIILLFQSN